MADPMYQFEVKPVVEIAPVNVPGLGLVDLSITNSTVAMFVAATIIILFFSVVTASPKVVPGRLQVVGEGMFPFVFTLFIFLLAMNMLGMFTVFTATAQLAVALTFAMMSFLLVVVVGLVRNGLGFFKLFLPSGVPWYLWWLVVPIEVISFLLRPVTLSLRLFGNMLGGHVAMKVFAGFIVSLSAVASAGGVAYLAYAAAVLAFGGVLALTALEFLVAFLQAFVFAVLTCVYLNDAVHAGDH
jgi:F-type H+-transporting ATPase subunit a